MPELWRPWRKLCLLIYLEFAAWASPQCPRQASRLEGAGGSPSGQYCLPESSIRGHHGLFRTYSCVSTGGTGLASPLSTFPRTAVRSDSQDSVLRRFFQRTSSAYSLRTLHMMPRKYDTHIYTYIYVYWINYAKLAHDPGLMEAGIPLYPDSSLA